MLLEPGREALVQIGAHALRQRVVGGVADQQVAEAEGVLARELGAVGADELLAHERDQPLAPLRLAVAERLDGAAVEDLALDGAALEHRALRRVELVEPRREQRLDRRRHRDVAPPELAGRARASPRGTAGCPRRPQRSARAAPASTPPSSSSSCSVSRGVERLEQHGGRVPLAAAPGGPALEQLRPGHAEQQDRRVAARGRRRARRGRGTSARAQWRSSKHADERPRLRLLLEQLAEAPRRSPRPTRRCSISPSSERSGRAARRSVRQRAELLQDLDHRPVRDALAVGEAAAAHDPRVDAGEELRREPRLADAGRAQDGEELARAVVRPRCAKRILQRRSSRSRPTIGVAKRRSSSPVDREQPERRHRLRLALELERLDRLDLDRVPHERERRLADQDLARLRRLLEPRGDVDRVAGREHAPRSPVTTSPVLTPIRPSMPRSGKRVPHLDRGAARPQRVVLVHDRHAEDRHHRVADELLDRAAVRARRSPCIRSK